MTPGWPSDCRQQARRNQSPTCCWASTEPGSGSRWLRTDLGASSTSPELHFLRVPCSRRDCQAVDRHPGRHEPQTAVSQPPQPCSPFPRIRTGVFPTLPTGCLQGVDAHSAAGFRALPDPSAPPSRPSQPPSTPCAIAIYGRREICPQSHECGKTSPVPHWLQHSAKQVSPTPHLGSKVELALVVKLGS